MHPHPVIEHCPNCDKGYYNTHLDDSLSGAESFEAEHRRHQTETMPIHRFDIGRKDDGSRYFRVRVDGQREALYFREHVFGSSDLERCDNPGSRIFDDKYAPVKPVIDLASIVGIQKLQTQETK